MVKKTILDLGCGKRKTLYAVGLDIVYLSDVDIIHDLNDYPYPFKDNFADVIIMKHSLEHTKDRIKTIKEVHRILKPNGILKIKVPHFSSVNAYGELDHYHFFCTNNFNQLADKCNFRIKKLKLNYIQNPNNHPFKSVVNFLVNPFININRWFTERLLCYYIGGISEIECEMIK